MSGTQRVIFLVVGVVFLAAIIGGAVQAWRTRGWRRLGYAALAVVALVVLFNALQGAPN